jgi:endonuclease YncB( thermonuclease family)
MSGATQKSCEIAQSPTNRATAVLHAGFTDLLIYHGFSACYLPLILLSYGTTATSLPILAQAADLQGRVVGIADSDTLTVLDSARLQHRVRIAGIDAPEKRQPCGERSRQHLASLAFQKSATLDCCRVDRYKRQVCRV